jgi:8-oxo-dGTP pyrophosphatase MutT (NUDIX family)
MILTVNRRRFSLIFVRDLANKKILLGLKKRGFGVNKFVGLGGKVEPDETLYECALRFAFYNSYSKGLKFDANSFGNRLREAKEESGLEIDDVKHVGCVEFQFEDKMNELLEVHVFCADSFRGELRECDGTNIEKSLPILVHY